MQASLGTRILYVDDDGIARAAFARQFNRLGFAVDAAATAKEALELTLAVRYPVVVTDLAMADASAQELIAHVHADAPHTAFIIVTGLSLLDLSRDSFDARGLVGVHPKPWDAAVLADAIHRAARWHQVSSDAGPAPIAVVLTSDVSLGATLASEVAAAGFSATTATSIDRAEAALAAQPELIVADLSTLAAPRFAGLARLKSLAPHTPILAIGNDRCEVLARQSVDHGAANYCLDGDIALPTFHRTIRRTVDLARGRFVPSPSSRLSGIDAEVRDALANRRFALHYQPQRDLRTGLVRGAEALLRMTRSDGTLVPPRDFIPALERTNAMFEIGTWVLETACVKAAQWHRAGHPHICVAVNLSLKQFERDGLVKAVLTAAEKAGVSPSALELEITEAVLMEDTELAVTTLRGLEQIGARIAIDDFGITGSSLAHLGRFCIDAVKIDRCFVSSIGKEASGGSIASAIIGLAHRLGLEVIGEGVETPEELAFLRSEGCDIVQGFLLGRPAESWKPRAPQSSAIPLGGAG